MPSASIPAWQASAQLTTEGARNSGSEGNQNESSDRRQVPTGCACQSGGNGGYENSGSAA
ncbi:hypothetical protein N7510_011362 [Penicillium lagena]|uniref:uncharacterized protein n=1 Tax=Penicillium lagena TaxID=94218 RepID=UPI002541BFD1|nr:uncharacterized protein N7510_011362 [Penicillium lagena]KAJ5601828.1 hypothetical protein N7510_011362 [Penicillium lagena]